MTEYRHNSFTSFWEITTLANIVNPSSVWEEIAVCIVHAVIDKRFQGKDATIEALKHRVGALLDSKFDVFYAFDLQIRDTAYGHVITIVFEGYDDTARAVFTQYPDMIQIQREALPRCPHHIGSHHSQSKSAMRKSSETPMEIGVELTFPCISEPRHNPFYEN